MRCTKIEMQRRFERVSDLLAYKSEEEVKTICSKEFGVVRNTITNYYIQPARQLICEAMGKSRKELIAQHHHRLDLIIRTEPKERQWALHQLATLLGLNAPAQVTVTVDALYNPEEQLRALSNPALLEKILTLDAEFEEVCCDNSNGESEKIPHRKSADSSKARVLDDQGLQVPEAPPDPPEGSVEFVAGP